jgi:hypothetical protein
VRLLLVGVFVGSCFAGAATAEASLKPRLPRRVMRLDGVWQVEQGRKDSPPETFSHKIPVPGLLDMADPPFQDVGRKSAIREAFWYRRTFVIEGPLPEIAILKLHKARYGTKVFLNGQFIAEHLPSFTPACLDVRPQLLGDGQENELVIRVGAFRDALPEGQPSGWDFEKLLYIPGIYDSVELILTNAPYIVNAQTVPDVAGKRVRVVAEIAAGARAAEVVVTGQVAEAASAKVVGSNVGGKTSLSSRSTGTVDFIIPIESARTWSPEDPFLYELTLATGADAARVRFGLRTFGFDPQSKRALLNGKPYYLRGSNITIYRFFEDAERADRPWREEWVRRLHRKLKTMHWNSLRYCIGFPPDFWYDIADEEGFLIQDEFPIWLLNEKPESPVAEKIIPEYTAWMRERWNHASVVIWDAQNESLTEETGKALRAVRHLDLSNRPWENGWAEPQSETDVIEAHPYLFIRAWLGQEPFRLSMMPEISGKPPLMPPQQKLGATVLINEYGWLWLNRDGTPTTLTSKVYDGLLGSNSTTEERRRFYARTLAALTEFWRAHREVAGVLHFCALGYSRPGLEERPLGGATSDHWIDVEKLVFEPHFEEYVREAFSPVGLMLDFWAEEVPRGTERELKVYVINDLENAWQGEVRLRVLREGREVSSQSKEATVPGLGREVLNFAQSVPRQPGNYTVSAELTDSKGNTVRSLRDFKVR